MQMLCPECGSVLQVRGSDTAWCPTHGGTYQILFWEGQIPGAMRAKILQEAPPMEPLKEGQKCVWHPANAAVAICQQCGQPMCGTCCFTLEGNRHLCPQCITSPAAGAGGIAGAEPTGIGLMCARHPAVEAIAQCEVCRTPICQTCCFTFPGNIRLCPQCTTSKPRKISSSRRQCLGWSVALAGWVTIALAFTLAGGLKDTVRSREDLEMVGIAFSFLVVLPALIGMGLSISAYERRAANPPMVWVAIVWNALLVGGLLLMTLVGIFS